MAVASLARSAGERPANATATGGGVRGLVRPTGRGVGTRGSRVPGARAVLGPAARRSVRSNVRRWIAR